MSLLRLEHVTKRFGRRLVMSDVSLSLARGDFVVLRGANGSGKTTLLRILSTILRPSAGRVAWEGASDAAELRARISFVGHAPMLYDELTALENIEFSLRMRGHQATDAQARAALGSFGLSGRERDRAAGLSRGERQRVALARAFATDPDILLFDEPGTGLDAAGTAALLDRLSHRPLGSAVVVATHEPDAFQALATRWWHVADATVREAAA